MQNTLTFLNKFFWWIIALLGAMIFIWWLVFSPLFQSNAISNLTATNSSSLSSSVSSSSIANSTVPQSGVQSSTSSTPSSTSSTATSSSSSSSSSSSAASTNLIPTTQKGKYVKTFINGDEGYLGVNFRKTPCGEKVGEYKAWNLKGTVNLTPARDDKCALGKYTWYFVEFDDNTKGWVVEDNLAFATTK